MRTAATGTTCRRRELVQDAEGGAPCGPGENRGACQRIDEARGGSGRGDSFARYAASRSVALLVTVLIAIGVHSRMAIAFLGIAMTSVQAFDGVIGALAHDPSRRTDRLPSPSSTHSPWAGSCEGRKAMQRARDASARHLPRDRLLAGGTGQHTAGHALSGPDEFSSSECPYFRQDQHAQLRSRPEPRFGGQYPPARRLQKLMSWTRFKR